MKKSVLMWVVVFAISASLIGWFVWPTPWQYSVEYWEGPALVNKDQKETNRVPIRTRTHRLTGEKQNQAGPKGEWGHFVW